MKNSKGKILVKEAKVEDFDYRLEDLIIDSFLKLRKMDGQSKKCYIKGEPKISEGNLNGRLGQVLSDLGSPGRPFESKLL